MSVLPLPVASTDALVLRSWTCGETSSIASYLTRDHGYVKVIAKAARRPRSRLRSLVEPGRLIAAEFGLDPGRQLQYLRGGSVHLDGLGCEPTLERSAFLLGALELVDRCRPREPSDAGPAAGLDTLTLFAVCEEFVRILSSPTCAMPDLAFFALEWNLLGLHGLAPDLTCCGACGDDLTVAEAENSWLAVAEGSVLCGACCKSDEADRSAGRPISPQALSIFQTLARSSVLVPDVDGWSRSLRREIGALLHGFLGYHLPGYRLPTALDLLRERKD